MDAITSNPIRCVQLVQGICTAWRLGDLAAIQNLHAAMLSAQPVTTRSITYERNRLWLPAILDHIRSGEPTLITVGLLHFVGDESVPALLHEEGFEVVPVVVDDAPRGVLSSTH